MLMMMDLQDCEFEFDEQLDLYKDETNEDFDNSRIQRLIRKSKAFLFAWKGELDNGWIVLRPSIHELSDEVYLLAWIGRKANGDIKASMAFQPCLQELASQIGAKYIEYRTTIPAVGRLHEKAGYELASTTYRKYL